MNEIVTAAVGEEIISIDQVVASTKMVLRLSAITDYDAMIEEFVNEGAGKINSGSVLIQKVKLLEIIDGKVKLPKGYKEWIAVKMIPDSIQPSTVSDVNFTTLTVNTGNDMLYLNKSYLNACGLTGVNNPMMPLGNTFQIEQGYIVLTFPLPDGVSRVLLGYEGHNVDNNGLYYVHAKMEIGLRAYAADRMLTTYPEIWPRDYINYYGTTVAKYSREWKEEFRNIRGNDAVRSFISNRYAIKRIWGALMWNQNR